MKFFLLALLSLSSIAQAITFKEWKKLSSDEKAEFLNYESSQFTVDIDSKKIISSTLSSARAQSLKSKVTASIKALANYQTELSTEVEDDYHGIVGSVSRSADLYFSDDNIFLGATIHYFQQGCSHMDSDEDYLEESGYYSTLEEARANNCIDNDVSWSGTSTVDELMKEICNSDYMEWSGH